MFSYTKFVREEGIELGIEKKQLEILGQLDLLHFTDAQIMTILKVDAQALAGLRQKLHAASMPSAPAMAD